MNAYWEWTDNYKNGTPGYIVFKAKDPSDKGLAKLPDGKYDRFVKHSNIGMTEAGKNSAAGNSTAKYSISQDIHICLPCCGSLMGNNLTNYKENGFYWASTINPKSSSRPVYTQAVYFGNKNASPVNTIDVGNAGRFKGCAVRPVCD